MAKQTYYVSVGSGEIHSDPNVSSYQYKIEADESEIRRLADLFDRANDASSSSFFRVMQTESKKNQDYDDVLSSIYQTIHDLGDDATREHIVSMDILH